MRQPIKVLVYCNQYGIAYYHISLVMNAIVSCPACLWHVRYELTIAKHVLTMSHLAVYETGSQHTNTLTGSEGKSTRRVYQDFYFTVSVCLAVNASYSQVVYVWMFLKRYSFKTRAHIVCNIEHLVVSTKKIKSIKCVLISVTDI